MLEYHLIKNLKNRCSEVLQKTTPTSDYARGHRDAFEVVISFLDEMIAGLEAEQSEHFGAWAEAQQKDLLEEDPF